jgi:hypothetical protein
VAALGSLDVHPPQRPAFSSVCNGR